jgi:hydrogenase maturation protease
MKVRLIGIGNPGRQDDGLGPALIDKINSCPPFSVNAEWRYQLNIEDAQAIQDADVVIFADAATEGDEPATLTEITPASDIAFTTHALAPESVLALAEELYGRAPKAYVLAIRGYAWDIGEGLSPRAEVNLEAAIAQLSRFFREQD